MEMYYVYQCIELKNKMNSIKGSFIMTIRDDEHGEEIEDIFDEIENMYELKVIEWKQKKNMIIYKKIEIKNEEDVDEIEIDDIEPITAFGDIHFLRTLDFHSAIAYSYDDNELKHKVAKLNKSRDWIIREYKGELYLIALKKDVNK